MSSSPSRQRKSRINLGTINLTCSIDTCTCILGCLCSPLLRWKLWTPLDLVGEYLRDPGASTVGIQPWCALHHCLPIHAGHTQYTYHSEHIIIYRCKWGKNLQQESQNYHSTMHYACPLSELFVHGDLAKMNTRDGVRRICQMLYPKNLCNSKLTWSEHLECRWRDSVWKYSPQNTGRAEKVIQLCLEKWDLHVRLYTLTKLAHFIPRCLENVKKKIKEAILVTNISVIRYKMNKE